MGCATDEDLIVFAIAAIVVKKHSTSNEKLEEFDRVISSSTLSDSHKKQLLDFFVQCYGYAEKFDDKFRGRYEPQFEKETMDLRTKFIQNTVLFRLRALYFHDMDYKELYEKFDEIFSYVSDPKETNDSNVIEMLTFETTKPQGPLLLSPSFVKEIRRDKLIRLLVEHGYEAESVMNEVEKLIDAAEDAQIFAQYNI